MPGFVPAAEVLSFRRKYPKPSSPAPSPFGFPHCLGRLSGSLEGASCPCGWTREIPLAPLRAGLRLGRHSARRKAEKLPETLGDKKMESDPIFSLALTQHPRYKYAGNWGVEP